MSGGVWECDFAARGSAVGNRAIRRQGRAGAAAGGEPAGGDGFVRGASTAPGPGSHLSARLAGRRLSPLRPRAERATRVQRHLCAGIPAERHGDRAAPELLLASRLIRPAAWRGQRQSVMSVQSLMRSGLRISLLPFQKLTKQLLALRRIRCARNPTFNQEFFKLVVEFR
jgi:hypothetical protein